MPHLPWKALVLAALAACAIAVGGTGQLPPAAGPTSGLLEGAWTPVEYVLAEGARHRVDGRIFFTATDWTVLFFVLDEGVPRRGSGEGGTYEVEGDRLVFRHRYHLSGGEAMAGLPESPLRMRVTGPGEAAREDARFEIEGDRLTIRFPSGNRMVFIRSG